MLTLSFRVYLALYIGTYGRCVAAFDDERNRNHHILMQLEDNFDEAEVKEAGWQLGPDKAPKMDGFSILFYRILGHYRT